MLKVGAKTGAALPMAPLISIVDDDRSFRDSMQRLVKSFGYRVLSFPSAAAFLASPGLGTTACLVADIHMPDMTGIDLYKHLRDTGREIPTILITAYPDERAQKRMLSQGVECYLRKPLEEADLIECLRMAVSRKQH